MSHGRATRLTTNSASDHARTPAKKNALEMMPVAITNAKQLGSRAAISVVSQGTKGLKARELFALRRPSGCGTLRRLLMLPRTFVRKGLPSRKPSDYASQSSPSGASVSKDAHLDVQVP